ncbi:MAG: thioredoxin domain-containing protein [Chitinophagales bacterium]|nr:thioredoxin domain-containing protein [Chitinophagales bacterium]
MKKIIVLLIGIFALLNGYSQGIEFFHGTFDEAKQKAKEEGKLIFMDAYAVWCGPCKMMSNNVFPQQEVGDFFNANFVNMKVDMEKGEGVDIRRQYGVSAYPTMMLIDANGEVVQSIKGARDANSLIQWAKTANVPNQGMAQKLQEQYDAGERSPELLKSLINIKDSYKEDYNTYFEEYLKQLSEEDKVNTETANFIFEKTKSINSPGLKVINDYKEYFIDMQGENAFNTKIIQIAKNTLSTKDADENTLKEVLAFVKSYKPANYNEESAKLSMNFYGDKKDWNNYDKAATKYLSKYKKNDDNAARDIAWIYYMNIDDASKISKAEKWMQKSIAQNNSYENNLMQAYLLYKLEKYSEAEDAVNYALILAGEEKKTQNAQILKNKILEKLGKKQVVE